MSRNSAYDAIGYVYKRIKGTRFSVEFDSLADFYEWSKESGWDYGKKLRRLNTSEGYSRDNCVWMDAEKARRYDSRDDLAIIRWNDTVTRIRENLKNLPPPAPTKERPKGREFFRYEHPDLVREGICFISETWR